MRRTVSRHRAVKCIMSMNMYTALKSMMPWATRIPRNRISFGNHGHSQGERHIHSVQLSYHVRAD